LPAIRRRAQRYGPVVDTPLFEIKRRRARRVADYLQNPSNSACVNANRFPAGNDGISNARAMHEHSGVARRASSRSGCARAWLSGDGGDDVLLGSSWPYLKQLLKKVGGSARSRLVSHIGTLEGCQFPVGNSFGIPEPIGTGQCPSHFHRCREDFVKRLN